MTKLEVTKDFQTFVDGVFTENYNEVYELYQVVSENHEAQCTCKVEPCNDSEDILIIHEPSNNVLLFTLDACSFFPK